MKLESLIVISKKILTNVLLYAGVFTGLILISPLKSVAQIAFKVGSNYSSVRHEIPLKNIKPVIVSELGASVQYYPFKKFKNWSLINEFCFSQKGYQQNLSRDYTFRFDYCTFPVLINYAPVKHLSVHTGVELSTLFSTNVRRGLETYNHFDTGLVLGFSINKGRVFSFYLRGIYGLLPLLDYYKIDEMGNFTGEIHDLKNMCLSFGVKINVFNEKFRPYL
jgi:hypothetical protein